MTRTALAADTTFHFSPSGTDADTADGSATQPWKSAAYGYNRAMETLDLAGYGLTFQLGAGTYPDHCEFYGTLVGQKSPVEIVGDLATPTNCILQPNGFALGLIGGAWAKLSGVYTDSSLTTADTLLASEGSKLELGQGMWFGPFSGGGAYNHITVDKNSCLIVNNNYKVWAPSYTKTATYAAGATSMIVTDASSLRTFQGVTGPGMPAGQRITSISGTTVWLALPTTSAGTNTSVGISNGGQSHIFVSLASSAYYATNDGDANLTITIEGLPAFQLGFAFAYDLGVIHASSLLFKDSVGNAAVAQGKRYEVRSNGVINTNGGGPSYFPGNVAGVANGGLYV